MNIDKDTKFHYGLEQIDFSHSLFSITPIDANGRFMDFYTSEDMLSAKIKVAKVYIERNEISIVKPKTETTQQVEVEIPVKTLEIEVVEEKQGSELQAEKSRKTSKAK